MGAAFLRKMFATLPRRRRRGAGRREVHGTIAHGYVSGRDGRRYGAGTRVKIAIDERTGVASVAGRPVHVIGHVGMARDTGSNYLATFPAGTLDEHAVVLLIEDPQQAAWLSST
jgi:hypothetical protein